MVGNVSAKCIGGTDLDGDGYCSTQDPAGDSGGPCGVVPNPCPVLHGAWTTTAAYNAALTAFDTDLGGGDNVSSGDPGGSGADGCTAGRGTANAQAS